MIGDVYKLIELSLLYLWVCQTSISRLVTKRGKIVQAHCGESSTKSVDLIGHIQHDYREKGYQLE